MFILITYEYYSPVYFKFQKACSFWGSLTVHNQFIWELASINKFSREPFVCLLQPILRASDETKNFSCSSVSVLGNFFKFTCFLRDKLSLELDIHKVVLDSNSHSTQDKVVNFLATTIGLYVPWYLEASASVSLPGPGNIVPIHNGFPYCLSQTLIIQTSIIIITFNILVYKIADDCQDVSHLTKGKGQCNSINIYWNILCIICYCDYH